jgi:membrane protein implicated in regulation of membrane protease activity
MVLLVVIAAWAMLSLIALAAWFIVGSGGLTLQLIAALLIVMGAVLMWRQFRRRPQPPTLDQLLTEAQQASQRHAKSVAAGSPEQISKA